MTRGLLSLLHRVHLSSTMLHLCPVLIRCDLKRLPAGLENDILLPTRSNNLSSNNSSTTKATNSLSTTSKGGNTTIPLLRNIIKW